MSLRIYSNRFLSSRLTLTDSDLVFPFSLRFYNKNTRTVFHQWLEGVGAGEEVCSFVWRILFNLTKYQQDEEEALILVGNQMNVSDRIFSC